VRVALVILLVCAAADLVACAVLLALVWAEHRRMRREAAAAGEPIPSAARQLGCLFALAVVGLVGVYGIAWMLLSE
jgi:uncharacterized membrane protein